MNGYNSAQYHEDGKIPFEEALEKAGFGLFNFLYTSLIGFIIIAFVFVSYGSTIIVPASACELGTTATQRGMLAAAPVIGLLLGAVLWGYLGDTRGRRRMLLVTLVCAGSINSLASISVNWIMLLVLQFIASIFASGLYSLSMTLLSETVPVTKRNLVLLLVTSIFLLSQGLMAVLAIPIIPLSFSNYLPALDIFWNSWRTLMLVYSMPSLITALCLFFLPESPKFVLSQGDEDKALEILRRIYRINNRGSKEEYQVKGVIRETEKKEKASMKDQIVPLFRAPLLKFTIIMTSLLIFQQVGALLVWLPTVANQFMQMFASDNWEDGGAPTDLTLCQFLGTEMEVIPDPNEVPCSLNVNAMLIVLSVAALQSMVNLIVSMVVNKVGRRNLVMVITAVCGTCGILVNLVPNTIASGVLYVLLLVGIIVVGLYTALAVALFPTHLRVLAVSVMLTGGRIGTFASIQILNLLLETNCDAGFYIFSSLFAASAIIAFFLPDERRLLAPQQKQDDDDDEEKTEL
ncbi:unnamed protein product [Chilo suppressalis]|uniref:Major facilitator superfamily (MFS) profile domain-containing protein n=1 Tax=Chilo suppressalis TaxID=168631 RepID=A0ABN8AVU7_CHISP|nr:unnamed protein product [Chilo suppressalis]